MRYITQWREEATAGRVGGKAHTLMHLARAGFQVPEGFVLDAQAFYDSLNRDQSAAFGAGSEPGRLRSALADVMPAEEVRRELAAALIGLGQGERLMAVRSSGADEDGLQHSFAGQLKSFLYVRPEDLNARVADVWRSGFGEAVCAYRAEHGLSFPPPAPAVIVQRMIDPDAAGVAFSADPLTGDRSLATVASTFGAGTAVVSGETDSDLHQVDPRGRIVMRRIACKRWAHRSAPGTPDGVGPVPVAGAAACSAALSDAQLRRVADTVRRVAALLGRPQDIEWAYHGRPAATCCRRGPSPPWTGSPTPEGRAGGSGTTATSSRATAASPRRSPSSSRAAPTKGSTASSAGSCACRPASIADNEPCSAHARPDPRAGLLQPAQLVSPDGACCRATALNRAIHGTDDGGAGDGLSRTRIGSPRPSRAKRLRDLVRLGSTLPRPRWRTTCGCAPGAAAFQRRIEGALGAGAARPVTARPRTSSLGLLPRPRAAAAHPLGRAASSTILRP